MRLSSPLVLLFSSLSTIYGYTPPSGSYMGVPGTDAEFDYVVVGGGTAGLPLATRLAEDGRYSVAVLEAGGYYDVSNGNHSIIPGYDFHSSGPTLAGANPLIDWMFMTEPRVNGKPLHYTRGKGFGGTSARNFLIYQRPDEGTMDAWAKAVGDESWSWENVLPAYRKSATLTPPDTKKRPKNATVAFDKTAFGDGPLQVSYPHFVTPGASWFVKALEEVGIAKIARGIHSGELLGYSTLGTTIDPATQERSFADPTYGKLAREKTGLVFYTRALVKKVLFDKEKKATGVSVHTEGVTYTVNAKKEVILSAGAIQSPQLLMVSGIGPKDSLSKLDIDVVSDLPGVGQNLMDHPMFGVSWPIALESMATYLINPARLKQAIDEYNEHRLGFLTSPGPDVCYFGRFGPEDDLPSSIMEILDQFPPSSPHFQQCYFGLWVGEELGSIPPDADNYGSIIMGLLQPLSRGSVRISSADVADAPLIDGGMLSDPIDRKLAAALLRKGQRLVKTKALQAITREGIQYPPAGVTSDEELQEIAVGQGSTFWHAGATCKMGLASDPMAVVNSRGKVFGVKNLRVVDLSAVPFLPPGQPQSTVYMMAEKQAEDILRGEETDNGENGGHDEL